MSNYPKIIIITGDINSGKTSTIKKLVNFSKEPIAGIISEGIFINNEKVGYKIIDIVTQKEELLISTTPIKTDIKLGRFYFSLTGLEFGQNILFNIKNEKIVIIDELGFLELNKKGFFKPIKYLLKNFTGKLVLVIRYFLIQDITRLFNIEQFLILDIRTEDFSKIFNTIFSDF